MAMPTEVQAKTKENAGFANVAEHEIDRAGAEQQREHRLAQHFEDEAEEVAPRRPRQQVRAFSGQSFGGLLFGQTFDAVLVGHVGSRF